MNKFNFLKAFFSPFIRPKVSFYFGKIAYGTPYFFPRRLVKDKDKPGYLKFKPKKIGFDFVGLGWKTKWDDTDYRFEWSPMWSFVFFKYQFCVLFNVPHPDRYWESWLFYELNTDKKRTGKVRIQCCMCNFSQSWTFYNKDKEKEPVDYYTLIVKKSILKDVYPY